MTMFREQRLVTFKPKWNRTITVTKQQHVGFQLEARISPSDECDTSEGLTEVWNFLLLGS